MFVNRLQSDTLNNRSFRALKRASFLTFSVLLVSCAGDPAARSQASSDEECVYVRVTGSNLPVKECRSRAEREALAAGNREASEELFRQNQVLDETGAQSLGADSLD